MTGALWGAPVDPVATTVFGAICLIVGIAIGIIVTLRFIRRRVPEKVRFEVLDPELEAEVDARAARWASRRDFPAAGPAAASLMKAGLRHAQRIQNEARHDARRRRT